MEFYFNINDIFKEPIVEIDQNLLPVGFSGDKRQLWDTVQKVTQVVNSMGEASARAQCLPRAITTTDRFRNSDHKLYFMVDPQCNRGRGVITGMLKTGKKPLYVFDERGQYFQVNPSCVLDFYVPETRQRSGLGKRLFEHMLGKEQVKPEQLAVDRPSEKLLGFLGKHYNLREPLKQRNNFVVYKGFFPNSENKKEAGDAPQRPKIAANGLQFHNYAVSEPKSSMEQIVQNQQLMEGNVQQNYQQYPQNYQPQYQYYPRNQQQEKLYPVDQSRFNNGQIQAHQMSQSQPNLTQMQYTDPRLLQTKSEPNTSGFAQQYQQYPGYQQFQGVQPESANYQPIQAQETQQLQPVMNHIQSQLNNMSYNQMQSQLQPVTNQSYNQMQAQQNAQLIDQQNAQLTNQIQTQQNTQLHNQMQSQSNTQLTQQIQNQPNMQLTNQIQSQPIAQLQTQQNTQLHNQIQSQTNAQLSNQIQSQSNTQLTHQMQNQPNTQLTNQIQSLPNVQFNNQVQSPQSAQLSSQSYNQIYTQQIPQSANQVQNTQSYNPIPSQPIAQLQPNQMQTQSNVMLQPEQNQLISSAQYPVQHQLVNQGYQQSQLQPVTNQSYDQVISAQSQPAVLQNYNQPQTQNNQQTAFVTPVQSQLLNQTYNPMQIQQSQAYNQPQEHQIQHTQEPQPQSMAYRPSQVIHTNDSNQVSQLVFNKPPEETPQTQPRQHHVLHENMLAMQCRPQVMPQQTMPPTGEQIQSNVPQMNAGDMSSTRQEIKLKEPEIREERTDGIDRVPKNIASPRTANPLEETITRYGYPAQKPRQASFV